MLMEQEEALPASRSRLCKENAALKPQVDCFVSGRTCTQNILATNLPTQHLTAAEAEQ